MDNTGNLEPKKSAFRVRTKVGSQQGLRQSGVIGEGIPPPVRPTTKQEDKPKREHKMTQSLITATKAEMEENEAKVEEVPAETKEEDGVEKGEGYVVKNFKTKTAGMKQQATIKLSKLYVYEDMEVFATRFSPDDTCLAIGLSNGTIEIKQLSGTKKSDSFQTSIDELPATHVRWKSNKRLLCTNVEGFLIEYDTVDCVKVASVREEDNQILALDYAAEIQKIATSGKDACVRIYDDTSKRLLRTYEKGSWYSPGHSNRVFAAKFKPNDQNCLVTGGWDASVFIWDIRQAKHVAAFVGPNISGDTIDMKDEMMLIGSHRAKDSLELWDYGTRKKICNVEIDPEKKVDNAYVYTCQYSKTGDDQIIAGMAIRNEIRIFDRNITYVPSWSISAFERAIYTLDWGNKGRKVAFGGGAGKAYVFKYTTSTE